MFCIALSVLVVLFSVYIYISFYITENNTSNTENAIKKHKFKEFVIVLISTLITFIPQRFSQLFSSLVRSQLGADVSRQDGGRDERDARAAGNHRQVQGLAGRPHRVHLPKGHRPFQNR